MMVRVCVCVRVCMCALCVWALAGTRVHVRARVRTCAIVAAGRTLRV